MNALVMAVKVKVLISTDLLVKLALDFTETRMHHKNWQLIARKVEFEDALPQFLEDYCFSILDYEKTKTPTL